MYYSTKDEGGGVHCSVYLFYDDKCLIYLNFAASINNLLFIQINFYPENHNWYSLRIARYLKCSLINKFEFKKNIDLLNGTVQEFFKTLQQIRLCQRIINLQVSCKIAYYVGSTTYLSVCVFWQAFDSEVTIEKPTEMHSLEQVDHPSQSAFLHETYILIIR